jgi:hypothetical protein
MALSPRRIAALFGQKNGQAGPFMTATGGTWKQTSYNGTMRGRFAGVGYTYDPVLDVFSPPYLPPNPPMKAGLWP